MQSDELPVLMRALRAKTTRLKTELEQREAAIRMLTGEPGDRPDGKRVVPASMGGSAIAGPDAGREFRRRQDATQAQRQLIESVRPLYLAEVERQRLVEQLERLLAGIAVQQRSDGRGGADEGLLATSALASGNGPEPPSSAPMATLESAKVLDVNPNLQLVVLDVGLLQGARMGMPLVVLRGDRWLRNCGLWRCAQRICGALIENVTDEDVTARGRVTRARVTKS